MNKWIVMPAVSVRGKKLLRRKKGRETWAGAMLGGPKRHCPRATNRGDREITHLYERCHFLRRRTSKRVGVFSQVDDFHEMP